MNRRYQKGRRFEYRVKQLLSDAGYYVIRSAASKAIDLVAIAEDHVLLLECKAYRPYKSTINEIREKIPQWVNHSRFVLFFVVYPSKDKSIRMVPLFGDNHAGG